MLNTNWRAFKKELHKAIKKFGASKVRIISDEQGIYAVYDGEMNNLVTKWYAPDILTQDEINQWRTTLQCL
jgi:hypothetical protein